MTTGTIFDIKRFAIHDGPGLRTTVFFKGCPLDCWACHNPEGKEKRIDLLVREDRCTLCGDCIDVCESGSITLDGDTVQLDRATCTSCGACVEVCLPGALAIAGREVSAREVLSEIERDMVFYDQSGGGVTFSGGEPLSQPEFLLDLMSKCRERCISTVLDTSGFAPLELVESVAGLTDLFLYDVKLMDAKRHQDFTGTSNHAILQNLEWLAKHGPPVIIRFPLLPGINDDAENIGSLGRFVSALSSEPLIDVLPYHRVGIDKYTRLGHAYRLADEAPPTNDKIRTTVRTLRTFGLEVKVRGDSYDDE